MTEHPYNRAGVKAAIHYIARKYALEPEKLGAVKLHKILWNSEIQMLRCGIDAFGETFIKRQYGPCSEHLDELVNELVSDQRLAVRKPTDEYEATLFVGKGTADHASLSDVQWRIVDQVAERIVKDYTATSISERSHGPIWDAVEMFDPMLANAAALQWISATDTDSGVLQDSCRINHAALFSLSRAA